MIGIRKISEKHKSIVINWGVPVIVLVAGILMNFHNMIFSGFEITHRGLGDARLVNYTLEHGYRWLAGYLLHSNFWNPPIFYPAENVSAFTDLMLGFGPFYWIWRFAGIDPYTSFQLWLITVFILNFLVAFIMLREYTGARILGVATGAFFIAFGFQRTWGHVQMIPLFYIMLGMLAIYKLVRIVRTDPEKNFKSNKIFGWVSLLTIVLVFQAYGAIYNLIFFMLLLGVFLIISLLNSRSRTTISIFFKKLWKPLTVSMISAIIVLIPLLKHYGMVLVQLGGRNFDSERCMNPMILFSFPEDHWLYGSLTLSEYVGPLDASHMGIGILCLVISIIGLFKFWHQKSLWIVIIPVIIVLILGMEIYGFSPWYIVHHYFPGGKAIRAVSRIALISFIPVSLGLVCGLTWIQERRGIMLAALIAVACMAEQYQDHGGISKTEIRQHMEETCNSIPPDCDAFLLVSVLDQSECKIAEDAEWAGLLTGIPTVNGRYGNIPKRFHPKRLILEDTTLISFQKVEQEVHKWMEYNNRSNEEVCIILHECLKQKNSREDYRKWFLMKGISDELFE